MSLDEDVLGVFRSYARPEIRSAVSVDSHLQKDLGLNSYDYYALLEELETKTQVEVDITSVMHAQTVGDIVEAIERAGDSRDV